MVLRKFKNSALLFGSRGLDHWTAPGGMQDGWWAKVLGEGWMTGKEIAAPPASRVILDYRWRELASRVRSIDQKMRCS